MAGTGIVVRARLRDAWFAGLALAVLIGLSGGVAIALVSASRRVTTSYDRLLAEVDSFDHLAPYCGDQGCAQLGQQLLATGAAESVTRIVQATRPVMTTHDGRALGSDPARPCDTGDHETALASAPDGWGSSGHFPVKILEGHVPRPGTFEVVVTRAAARRVGITVGDPLTLLATTCDDLDEPKKLDKTLALTVVGIGVGALDVDVPGVRATVEPVFATTALFDAIRREPSDQVELSDSLAIWAAPGPQARDVITRTLGPNFDLRFAVSDRAKLARSGLRPDSNSLELLALIIAAAGAAVLGALLGNHLRRATTNLPVLRALGFTRRDVFVQGIAHASLIGGAAALVAGFTAALASPFVPRGIAESIEPGPGFYINWSVVIVGAAAVLAGTIVLASLPAWRAARARPASLPRKLGVSARVARALQLRPSVATGVRAASEPNRAEHTVPVRQSLGALVVAAASVAGALTFVSGVAHLRATPRVLGWNWDALVTTNGDAQTLIDDLAARPGVERVTGVEVFTPWYGPTVVATEKGRAEVFPAAFATGSDAIGPVATRGRPAVQADEALLSAHVARDIGARLGDIIRVTVPDPVTSFAAEHTLPPPHRRAVLTREFVVVGIGVLTTTDAQARQAIVLTLDGLARMQLTRADLETYFPDLRPDDAAKARAATDGPLSGAQGAVVDVRGNRRNAPRILARPVGGGEVIAPPNGTALVEGQHLFDLARAERVPRTIAWTLALVGAAVLLHLVLASVRARRRELAILRVLGFGPRDTRISVVWQAVVVTLLPLAIGIPIGVVGGRVLWNAYASDLEILPEPATPWIPLVAMTAIALGLALVVGAVAGTSRRVPARDLRFE